MRVIEMQKNSIGDTRTAKRVPTITEFDVSNGLHQRDVREMMEEVALCIHERSTQHDLTKTLDPGRSMFYRELCATIEGKMNFTEDGEWYKHHCEVERHHLNERCPDDVNLIDVIEMICDCVCAGMARKGCVYPIEIGTDVLKRAVFNTAKMLADVVVLVDGE